MSMISTQARLKIQAHWMLWDIQLEQRRYLLVVRAQQAVQLLQILSEHGLIIATCQGDLKHLTARDVGSQFGQALLPRATHANQQGIPLNADSELR